MPQLIHKGLPVLSFEDGHEFYVWLAKHHTQTTGFWLRYYKKSSGVQTIIHDTAVDMALCWGWVDGLINKYDDISYVVRYTPRRQKSIWSKVNVAKVEKLIAQDLMQPPGLVHVTAAKKDGRWDNAYEPASKMTVPEEFIKLIKKDKVAYEFYKTLDKANLYAIGFRLTIKDPIKFHKKMVQIIDQLHNQVYFHSPKK
jgi:uncharacterized protein YdeI (YjbR/CyaY-like superfamily)